MEGKRANRGYPQGSILGPQIWKLVMNGLIEESGRVECEIVAYVDDGAIIVWGN